MGQVAVKKLRVEFLEMEIRSGVFQRQVDGGQLEIEEVAVGMSYRGYCWIAFLVRVLV